PHAGGSWGPPATQPRRQRLEQRADWSLETPDHEADQRWPDDDRQHARDPVHRHGPCGGTPGGDRGVGSWPSRPGGRGVGGRWSGPSSARRSWCRIQNQAPPAITTATASRMPATWSTLRLAPPPTSTSDTAIARAAHGAAGAADASDLVAPAAADRGGDVGVRALRVRLRGAGGRLPRSRLRVDGIRPGLRIREGRTRERVAALRGESSHQRPFGGGGAWRRCFARALVRPRATYC